MTSRTRPSMVRRAMVLVAAAAVAVLGLAAPSSAAGPGPVLNTWRLPPGYYELGAGMGAMWVVNVDEFRYASVYRIDPMDNAIAPVVTLPFAGANLKIAFGSLWITDYFGNAVWRIAPDGHVEAAISVGLQPEFLDAAFGSMWISNHHGGSVSRVDPATNTVTATIPVGQQHRFRNGPQGITHDADQLYVGSSNLFRLQTIDPATDAVATPASRAGDDQFCGDLHAVGGYVWSTDNCSVHTYQLGLDGSPHLAIDPAPGSDLSQTVSGNNVWIGEDRVFDPDSLVGSDAALVRRNPVTGALVQVVPIGGDASVVRAGFGDLWVFDATRNTVRRVAVTESRDRSKPGLGAS